ncbi:TetR/AcrR family transcriptional regulator [Streptomyces triticagri]|uniref:TetR/AcrR family transcriptional regulator n=1 Tax=Streptomyces triticagri TaxID=2293568 RepID=UPI001314BAE3|nr:TetR/AcrR family transcriptional regulator [Streptomyces triticagri]
MAVKSGGDGGRRSVVDGRRERWRSHRAARRAEFVDAALRSLARTGPELRVDQVAAEAGVSKPVLYRQFTDKADLLAALHERATAIFAGRLAPALAPAAASPNALIRGAVDAFFSVLDDHPDLYRLVSRTLPTGPGREGSGLRQGRTLAAATLTQLFDEYLHAFGADTRDAAPLAQAVVGMVQQSAEWWLETRATGRGASVDFLTRAVWDVVDGALRRQGIELDPELPVSTEEFLTSAGRRTPDEER